MKLDIKTQIILIALLMAAIWSQGRSVLRKRFEGSNQVEQKMFKTSFYQKNSGLDFTKPTIRILTAALELSKED